MELLYKIYGYMPEFIQNMFVTGYNIKSNRIKCSGIYSEFLDELKRSSDLNINDLKEYQLKRFKNFVIYCAENSKYYKEIIEKNDIKINSIDDIKKFPVISKEGLRKNIDSISTIDRKDAYISKTGGTTGKSLEVLFTHSDMQEKQAFLDYFRGLYGYKLGKKTAWFSGKTLLNNRDIKKNRFWKTDLLKNVRYYSTFHMKDEYIKHYIDNMIEFRPEYLSGFPSTISEIAKYGIRNNILFPKSIVKAVFTTAETVTDEMRNPIETFFHTKVRDQYASSEGAPFIYECPEGNMHMDLRSGVFEVLDNNGNPCEKGNLVVTSFSTKGTPLIRYKIGDTVKLTRKTCTCGNNNPLVDYISGRINDFIFSPENGKINLGNVSNCLKGVHGIIKFQVIQEVEEEITVLAIKDESIFTLKDEEVFLNNFIERMGKFIKIDLKYVKEIPNEKSGKFRIVKNSLEIH